MKNKEVWKPIFGYEDLYEISNYGRVKSIERLVKSNNNNFRLQKESIRKPTVNNRGYFSIRLCKNGKYKAQFIHRLVAIAFIDNPNNLPEVNHKDEDKKNNRVENLEWCTRKYNMNYGTVKDKIIGIYVPPNVKKKSKYTTSELYELRLEKARKDAKLAEHISHK
ncbi:endonuclease [Lacrimispora amygdalina]|uniref:Endonuclease n=1 Tax=Lacrimispora amygdalina TaxID=253257 RepID=A0A3E2NBR1_9FIRM|nr:endonuclease [Clostridium indicum]